jgi:hypothetical protein
MMYVEGGTMPSDHYNATAFILAASFDTYPIFVVIIIRRVLIPLALMLLLASMLVCAMHAAHRLPSTLRCCLDLCCHQLVYGVSHHHQRIRTSRDRAKPNSVPRSDLESC